MEFKGFGVRFGIHRETGDIVFHVGLLRGKAARRAEDGGRIDGLVPGGLVPGRRREGAGEVGPGAVGTVSVGLAGGLDGKVVAVDVDGVAGGPEDGIGVVAVVGEGGPGHRFSRRCGEDGDILVPGYPDGFRLPGGLAFTAGKDGKAGSGCAKEESRFHKAAVLFEIRIVITRRADPYLLGPAVPGQAKVPLRLHYEFLRQRLPIADFSR